MIPFSLRSGYDREIIKRVYKTMPLNFQKPNYQCPEVKTDIKVMFVQQVTMGCAISPHPLSPCLWKDVSSLNITSALRNKRNPQLTEIH